MTRFLKIVLTLIVVAVAVLIFVTWRNKPTNQRSSGAATSSDQKILYWVDPMHPAYKSDKPGTAPDCGMDLVPVYESESASSTKPVGTVEINAQKQQLIGVMYATVAFERVTHTIKAVGKISFDETKITRVHPRFEGWIEKVYADFTGKHVKKGEPLLTLYSPELLASQQELLIASKGKDYLGKSTLTGVSDNATSLYNSARERLRLFEISDEQIAEVERTRKPIRALTLFVPNSGFVLSRNAYERQKIGTDTELYQIADLSTVWAVVDVYEYEAPMMKVGMPVDLRLSYMPDSLFRGRINYIYPQVDPATRTLKVRVEVPNPRLSLKPEMFVEAELKMDHGRALMVPSSAVLDSGMEQTIFVAHENGYFEPRKVKLGAKFGDRFEVISGLKDGERIVTSGNFLIDSESKLKSGTEGMTGHSGHTPEPTRPAPAPKQKPQEPERKKPTPGHEGHGGPQ